MLVNVGASAMPVNLSWFHRTCYNCLPCFYDTRHITGESKTRFGKLREVE